MHAVMAVYAVCSKWDKQCLPKSKAGKTGEDCSPDDAACSTFGHSGNPVVFEGTLTGMPYFLRRKLRENCRHDGKRGRLVKLGFDLVAPISNLSCAGDPSTRHTAQHAPETLSSRRHVK